MQTNLHDPMHPASDRIVQIDLHRLPRPLARARVLG